MIKNIIQSTLRKMGYQLCKYPPIAAKPRIECFFEAWSLLGPPPSLIVDIGANRGNWSRQAHSVFPEARIIQVEPQESLRPYSEDLLSTGKVTWVNAGISDCNGVMKLALHERDDSATFAMSEEAAAQRGFAMVEVPVVTINTLLVDEPESPSIIKIDAEGLDIAALRGADQHLGKTDVLLVECAITNSAFENTLTKVSEIMKAHGYRAFDITDLNTYPDHRLLGLVEVVFVLEQHPIWARVDQHRKKLAAAKS